MGPISAIGSVLSKYFQIRGRAPRSEFWWWSLAQFFGLLACISVDLALYDPAPTQIGFFSFVTPVYVLGTLIPNFTVTIRRLHDIGRSGLWYLISILPFGYLVLFVFFCLPSERDDNIYGPPPGGPRQPTGGFDISDPYGIPKTRQKSNPYAAYAFLAEGHAKPSPELRAAQREQVQSYYRQRVLGQAPEAG